MGGNMIRLGGVLLAALATPAGMTSTSEQQITAGETTRVFTAGDVAKLKFLEGRWSGNAPDGSVFYEEYDFPDAITLRSRRFPGASFARSTDGSTVTLRDGKLISTWGKFTWEAASVEDGEVTFRPLEAPSSFSWRRVSADAVEVTQNWTDEKGAAQRYALTLSRVR